MAAGHEVLCGVVEGVLALGGDALPVAHHLHGAEGLTGEAEVKEAMEGTY